MDGEPPQEEDFSQIPLVERSQHKNWKARLSAYNDIIAKAGKTASDTDPFFRPYVSDGALLKKWCLDANVVAQEKGIEAVLAIVQNSGESCARAEVLPALVEKALGATRAGTKKKGSELCAMFMEVENGGEGVMTDVLVGLESKQPKVVAGSITCLRELIESFGVPAMGNIKPLLKTLSKIFAHSDKTVRAEGTSLVLCLYTFLGAALTPSLAELKPVQMTELQKGFDGLDAEGKGAGTGKPTRWTRKAQREREAAEAAGGSGAGAEDAAEEEAAPLDPRSLLDPIDVLAKFPPDLEERLASTKWKDRLEALEECNAVIAQPQNARISDSNIDAYGSLASTLGSKCKSDANVNVVIESAKLIEGLARGIGRPFGRYRPAVMPGCLERLKERKATVAEALGKALDAVYITTTLPDIVDDTLVQLKSKNPQVREGTLRFLHRTLQTTLDAPGKDQVKLLAEALVALLADSAEPVRTAAADCLGTMMKILGERAFNPYVENVGDLQMAKVKDAFAKAEIKFRGGVKPPANGARPGPAPAAKKVAVSAVAKAGPPSSPPIKASGTFGGDAMLDEFAPPTKAPPARFSATIAPKASGFAPSSPPKAAPAPIRKPVAPSAGPSKPAAVSTKPPAAKAGPSKTLASAPSEAVKYRFSPEDAAAKATEAIPGDYHTKLADPAWKLRLEAAEEMVKWVEEENGSDVDSEVMMRFLGKTPGWGEKNFQVSAKLYQVMTLMAEKSPSFGKPAAALCIGPLTDKLGDIKLKKPAGDALSAFAEKTSLAFVLAQAYEPMMKQKAPKAQADALIWIKQQLEDFGIGGLPLRDLIGFVKTALGSPNALVRSSATQLLVTVKIFVGGDISGFIEDLNPQLLSTINLEFEKASGQTPPEPTRSQADLQESAAPGKTGKAAGADPLDDLIPRVDLDKLVNQTSVLTDARSDAWKTRKEAFEALAALLEVKSNSRLKPSMGEIGSVLKKAMADTNLAVKTLALGIIAKIATGMGQPFDKHARLLVAPIASVCADQKATTRSIALATLAAIADATGGLDCLYSGLASSLESTNPALRASELGWIAERLQADPPSSSADLAPLAGPVVTCLEDRNGDVRKGAGAVLPFIVANAGYDFVMDQTSKLKPASRSTIIPLIEKARAAAPAPAPAAAPPPKVGPIPAKTVKAPAPRSAPGSPAPAAVPLQTGVKPPMRSLAMKAIGSNAPTRPPSTWSQGDDRPTGLPRARAIPRPASAASHAPSAGSSAAASSKIAPFVSASHEARVARLKKDAVRWVIEPSPKADLAEYLQSQMEPHASPEIMAQLFSKDHRAEEDYMAALTALAEFYEDKATAIFSLSEDEVAAIQLANVDLALKYAALKLLSNNSQMISRCLEVISRAIEALQRLNERFSDAEAKLFVPALIFKLGDSKFVPKLVPIFESLDKIIAGSQVVQLLVQYGLEDKSAGRTCKNESLALIEKAYRKRGSILRTRDDRAFYEVVARCISDSGTRNSALSVMALLQMQGGSKSLETVIESLPQGSKDMLANRRATIATAKSGVKATEALDSPSRLRRPVSMVSPKLRDAAEASPLRAIPRPAESPSRMPRASDSPSAQRTTGIPGPTKVGAATSRLRPSDIFGGKPSLQPIGRVSRPTSNGHDPVLAIINDARNRDLNRSVDALKILQVMLGDEPDTFRDSVQNLVEMVMDQMEWAFTPPENLHNMEYFRMVKHLIQTGSAVSSNQDLMRRLNYDHVYTMISGLTTHLVEADRLGGNAAELSRFINLILIHVLATPDRNMVFHAMFRLLLSLIKDFEVDEVSPESMKAAHADLVVRCMWKRCKVLDEDFRSGRLKPGPLLGVLEDMLRVIPPAAFRRRSQEGVALGDMPLRTVKTIIQKMVVFARETGIEIYDILLAEFGDDAANTVVYSYIFRLAGQDTDGAGGRATPQNAIKTRVNPVNGMNASAAPSSDGSDASPKTETEAERLIRKLIGSSGQTQQLDELYAYITAHPDQEAEVQSAISSKLTTTVQTYVRRMLETRKAQDNPSPVRPEHPVSPRSPSRPESLLARTTPRRSLAPRPASLAVDKSAPVDDQLSHIKNIFNRGGMAGSTSGTAAGGAAVVGLVHEGRPLSEIQVQQRAELDVD